MGTVFDSFGHALGEIVHVFIISHAVLNCAFPLEYPE